MIHPTLDHLLKHADNRFSLVTVAAKRARQILEEDHADEEKSLVPVTVALEEILSGKTKYIRTKTGIK